MNKITVKTVSDIPENWNVLSIKKNTTVSIRESNGKEEFNVDWSSSVLFSDPESDIIVIQPSGKEYPCKRDIFEQTYELVSDQKYRKNVISKIVEIPHDTEVTIETLEGTLNSVSHPDYIAIGAKGELYANTSEFVKNNCVIL